jgi:hypothetical protein
MRQILWLGVLGIAAGGCFASPFVRDDGPVRAQGVTVSLVDQRCSVDGEDWDTYEEKLNLGMRVAIRNDTSQPLEISPANFRLQSGGLSVSPVSAAPARQLGPGASTVVWVQFLRTGAGACNAQMSLLLDEVVRRGVQAVSLQPVRFIASASAS